MKFLCLVQFIVLVVLVVAEEHGRSYHKFFGPVSGEIQKVYLGKEHGQKVDFVAKPDYTYSYGIQDPKTGNEQQHQETRDGDAVHGEYKLLQADGTTRIVRYTADSINGFQAVVEYH